VTVAVFIRGSVSVTQCPSPATELLQDKFPASAPSLPNLAGIGGLRVGIQSDPIHEIPIWPGSGESTPMQRYRGFRGHDTAVTGHFQGPGWADSEPDSEAGTPPAPGGPLARASLSLTQPDSEWHD
jgi:hypothetical protein